MRSQVCHATQSSTSLSIVPSRCLRRAITNESLNELNRNLRILLEEGQSKSLGQIWQLEASIEGANHESARIMKQLERQSEAIELIRSKMEIAKSKIVEVERKMDNDSSSGKVHEMKDLKKNLEEVGNRRKSLESEIEVAKQRVEEAQKVERILHSYVPTVLNDIVVFLLENRQSGCKDDETKRRVADNNLDPIYSKDRVELVRL